MKINAYDYDEELTEEEKDPEVRRLIYCKPFKKLDKWPEETEEYEDVRNNQ